MFNEDLQSAGRSRETDRSSAARVWRHCRQGIDSNCSVNDVFGEKGGIRLYRFSQNCMKCFRVFLRCTYAENRKQRPKRFPFSEKSHCSITGSGRVASNMPEHHWQEMIPLMPLGRHRVSRVVRFLAAESSAAEMTFRSQ